MTNVARSVEAVGKIIRQGLARLRETHPDEPEIPIVVVDGFGGEEEDRAVHLWGRKEGARGDLADRPDCEKGLEIDREGTPFAIARRRQMN